MDVDTFIGLVAGTQLHAQVDIQGRLGIHHRRPVHTLHPRQGAEFKEVPDITRCLLGKVGRDEEPPRTEVRHRGLDRDPGPQLLLPFP
jgi:hypothetical protein